MVKLTQDHITTICGRDRTLNISDHINKKELIKNFNFFKSINKDIFIDIITKNGNKMYINKVYFLPITSKYWDDFVNNEGLEKLFTISNYGLAINKFGRFNSSKLDYIAYNGRDKLYHKFIFNDHFEIITHTQEKQTILKKELENYYSVENITVKQNWRLVLNLGETTAYNNGFLLHPIYGIPYLSDTAIKGMVRTYVVEYYFAFKEEDALKNEVFVNLFGAGNEQDPDKGQQGLIKFANAFPVNTSNDGYTITADIINNHNKDYYADDNKDKYPTDTASPNPIKFITLKNAIFEPYFYIVKHFGDKKIVKISDKDKFSKAIAGKTLLEVMKQLMLDAFKIKGIGAKTNVGYGRLLVIEKPIDLSKIDLSTSRDLLDKLPKVNFENITDKSTNTRVIINDHKLKSALINVDDELKDVQLITKYMDVSNLKIGSIIDVVIQQISKRQQKIISVKIINQP